MRRQAGFIKTYSQVSFPAEPSEFSYFQVPPHRNNDEFSPYKFEEQEPETHILTQTHAIRPLGRPPRSTLPQQTLHKVHPASTLSDRVKADQLHQRIRQKIINNEEQQASGSHKLQENIGNIRSKIDKLDHVMRELQTGKEPQQQQRARSYEKIKRRFEEDSFSSSSSDEEEEELVMTAIPQQRTQQKEEMRAAESVQMRAAETVQQFGRRIVQAPSSSEEEQQQQHHHQQEDSEGYVSGRFSSTNPNRSPPSQQGPNVITFNSRLKDQPPIKIKQYSSSSDPSDSEESQQLHARNIPERDRPVAPTRPTSQFHKNKGGVCFDIDVRQFTAPVLPDEKPPAAVKKKQKLEDKRAEILRRRENAKAYDRVARRAVFSPHY